jgi:hypothetical protein
MPNPPLDDWNYPGVRDACSNRCGEFGDPPCYELGERAARGVNADTTDPIKPCGECWRDVGVEPGDEFDEDAAIRRLI